MFTLKKNVTINTRLREIEENEYIPILLQDYFLDRITEGYLIRVNRKYYILSDTLLGSPCGVRYWRDNGGNAIKSFKHSYWICNDNDGRETIERILRESLAYFEFYGTEADTPEH